MKDKIALLYAFLWDQLEVECQSMQPTILPAWGSLLKVGCLATVSFGTGKLRVIIKKALRL
ncbi:hypothetical protein D1627_12035 [Pontibacter oryzae]|uniref:Uncharacterized protein n=1 Tax=Pontibacter oryzae TaxID=2304593 RepID=A0A399S4Y5_9BACT|nr:hypothetical protein D1627_12035 [Pontibacter oryzae]